MLNIAVCNDIKVVLNSMLDLIEKYKKHCDDEDIKARAFSDGTELLELIRDSEKFDLLLLNVMMPEMNGINLARAIRRYDEIVPIIFMSGTTLYEIDAFRVSAAGYWIKPVNEETLFSALDKIRDGRKDIRLLYIPAVGGNTVSVPYDDISRIEVESGVVSVQLSNGDMLYGKKAGVTFTSITTPLSCDDRFVQASDCVMLNMEQTSSFSDGCFTMNNGEIIHVQKKRCRDVERKYQNYISVSQ